MCFYARRIRAFVLQGHRICNSMQSDRKTVRSTRLHHVGSQQSLDIDIIWPRVFSFCRIANALMQTAGANVDIWRGVRVAREIKTTLQTGLAKWSNNAGCTRTALHTVTSSTCESSRRVRIKIEAGFCSRNDSTRNVVDDANPLHRVLLKR